MDDQRSADELHKRAGGEDRRRSTSAPVDEMFLIFTGDDEPSQYSEAARVSVCRVSERRSLASCRNELCIDRLPPRSRRISRAG